MTMRHGGNDDCLPISLQEPPFLKCIQTVPLPGIPATGLPESAGPVRITPAMAAGLPTFGMLGDK